MVLAQARILWSMCLFEAQRFKVFPLEAIGSIVAISVEMLFFVTFWLIVGKFSATGNIDTLRIVGFYLIIGGLTPILYVNYIIGSEMIKMIKKGDLNQVLIRPISPILYPWAQRTGKNLLAFVVGIVQIVAGIIISGGLHFSGLSAFLLIPVFINALLINLSLNIIVGTTAFYFVEAGGFKNAFIHVSRLCRGEVMPLFLMPASVATALQWTPFPASQYHLTILLQGKEQPAAWAIFVGVMWSVILLFFAVWFWRRSLRRYEAIGI